MRITSLDVHPPAWYLVLKPWLAVFGTSVVAARAQSAVFMLVALGLWYRFVRASSSRTLALWSLALMVTNPMLLHYAIEGRMYAFGILLTAISCTCITSRWRWRWVAYWCVAVVMLYTHLFLALVVAAELVYVLCTRRDHEKSPIWVLAYGATIFAAFAPWVPYAFHVTSTAVRTGFWIPPVSLVTVPAYFLHAFLHLLPSDTTRVTLVPVVLYLVVIAAALVRAGRTAARPSGLLWCVVVIPFVALLLLSCPPLVPVFHARYVVFGLPAMIVLVAAGAMTWSGPRRIVVIAILFAGHVAGLGMLQWRGFTDTRRYWDMNVVASEVARPIDGELPAIVCTWAFPFFDAKATLGERQHVMHLRDAPPAPNVFPELLFTGHRDWWVTSLSEVHARYVWVIDEVWKEPHPVPPTWKPLAFHRRGYVITRLFERLDE